MRHKGINNLSNLIEEVAVELDITARFPESWDITQTVRLTFSPSLPLVLNVINNGFNINNIFVRLIIFQWCSSPRGDFQGTLTIIYI